MGTNLSQLFVDSGTEKDLRQSRNLSIEMGLFLQKTNIIRDYREDIDETKPRMFWPREIWKEYANELEEFKDTKNREKAISCLNEMITNALKHATKSLDYLEKLKNSAVLRFCAIPQIMAIATLALCYNNGKVFETNVKIRRGQSC